MSVPWAAALLETRQVEERLGQVVSLRLQAPRDLLPGQLVIGNVITQAELGGPDRVEYPACLPLD